MTAWTTHLMVERPDRARTDDPLANPKPVFSACGIRVYDRTWRGWATTPGGACIGGNTVPKGVDCASCIRTRLFAKAVRS